MNVAQLITQLQQYNPKSPIVVSGYEGGETIVEGVAKVELYYEPESSWWDGEYKQPHSWDEGKKTFDAVKIGGKRH